MRIVIAADALSSEVDGVTVILAPDMQFIRLDGTGSVIWQLIQGGEDVDGVVNHVCGHYDVDRDTASRDVRAFLEDLATKGVLSLHE